MTGTRTLRRSERIALAVVAIGALIVAAITAAAAAIRIQQALAAPTIRLDLDADATAGALRGLGGVTDASWTSASIVVTGMPPGERILLAAGVLLTALSWIAVSLAVAHLCRGLRSGRPFTAAATRTVWFAAFTLIVGPMLGTLLVQLGQNEAVLRIGGHDPLLLGFSFDPAAWGAGIALALVGLAFQLGSRLQRDTEGLV